MKFGNYIWNHYLLIKLWFFIKYSIISIIFCAETATCASCGEKRGRSRVKPLFRAIGEKSRQIENPYLKCGKPPIVRKIVKNSVKSKNTPAPTIVRKKRGEKNGCGMRGKWPIQFFRQNPLLSLFSKTLYEPFPPTFRK